MALGRRLAFSLLLAAGTLAVLIMASAAMATHPRPANNGALKQHTSLVQAMNQCTSPNRTHGAPLSGPSCTPPVPQSSRLRLGSQSRPINGLTTAAVIEVICNPASAGPPPCAGAAGDQEDVRLLGAAQDIRCVSAASVSGKCSPANAAPDTRPDYRGQVVSTSQIRITDAFNGATAAGGTQHATVIQLPFSVGVQCVATADTSKGSNCSVNTTADTVVPGAAGGGGVVKEGKVASVGIDQVQEFDTGPDGNGVSNPLNPGHCPPACVVDPATDKMFAYEGIYIP
jgi:hypothetical protein